MRLCTRRKSPIRPTEKLVNVPSLVSRPKKALTLIHQAAKCAVVSESPRFMARSADHSCKEHSFFLAQLRLTGQSELDA